MQTTAQTAASKSPRYGTPEWDAAMVVALALVERVMRGSDGTGRENYGRGRFESVL